jgi:peptide/nickel transport system ATP-binding protein
MTAQTDLLRVENLRISFSLHGGVIEAVRRSSLRILPGKVTALVGESGSGKSVMGQAILGILPRVGQITGGRILFTDPRNQPPSTVDLAALDPDGSEYRALRGGRIAMIFQEPMTSLSPVHTIGNQIQEALQLHQPVARQEARHKTEEMLGLVGFPHPGKAYDMYPFELSGGLRQRAMIAMALICRPALLIADEPTTALDVTIQAQILKLLRDLQQRFEMSMLLITHDLGVVANAADEVAVIYHGEIMEAGTVQHIFNAPQHTYLKALMAAVPHFNMKPGQRLASLRDIAVSANMLFAQRKRDAGQSGSPVLLSVQNLSKSFSTRKEGWFGAGEKSTVKAVDNVSFEIRRGECLGLVGESGCGKTTVSKLLMRAVTADSGTAVYDTEAGPVDLLTLRGAPLKKMRQRIQMVFQDPFSSLSPRMTVSNILREPLEVHGVGNEKSRAKLVAELMRAVGLDPRFQARYPHSFSGGQRQRIGIARALALDPDLLICDEPVSALDVSVQAQVLNLLKDLQNELGLTYLFISHNLAVVDYMSDRIAVMCRGRIVELAPREVLFKAPAHPYTRALLAAVPYPDLARPLDFKLLDLGGASDDRSWGPQFRNGGDPGELQHMDIGPGHLVLARKTADIRELRP